MGCEVKRDLFTAMTNLTLPFQYQSLEQLIGRYPSSSIVVIDHHGRISRTSTLFLQATAYSAEELQGKPHQEIFRGFGSLDDLYQLCGKQMRKSGSLPVIEVKKKGEGWLASGVIVTQASADRESSACGYILYLPDMNPKRSIPILSRFSDSFMRHVNLGVMLFDPYGHLVEVSEPACAILDRPRECIINKSIEELFASVPEERWLVNPSLLRGAVVRNQAVRWQTAHQAYDLLIDSNVLRDERGDIVGAYVIMKDVSNLRSLEAQLQRHDRLAMIGQIAAGTAHEIRNPLTSLRGFIQLLQSSLEHRRLDREVGYLQIMKSEIDRINELVGEFLLLSKPKNVSYRPTSVSRTIRMILPIIESEANLHGIKVSYEAEENLPLVIADSELLKQVFLNICKNAIEAMQDAGELVISERIGEARHVHIDIRDSGSGIPSYMLDRIFDPFFTTKENGTGLGLAVCQRIIHDMGGQIRVQSDGSGTIFTILLPYSI